MVNSIIGMALTPTRNSYRDLEEIQQAQQKEHRKNNAKTAFGVGLAVGLPTAAGYAVYKNPDKAQALLTQYGKKADTIFNNKLVNKAKEVIREIVNRGKNKVKAEKVTSNITKDIDDIVNKLMKNHPKEIEEIEEIIKKVSINPKKIDYSIIKGKIVDLLKDPNKLTQKIKDFINHCKISAEAKKTKLGDMLKNPYNVIDEVSNIAKKAAEKLKDVKPKLNVNIDAKTIQKNGLLSKIKTHVGDAINKLKGTKIYDTASKTIKDFMSKTPAQKGKIALVAAGVALTASVIINLIRNHDYEAGKIDQKYEDMKRNNPIINAQTGEVISKERYEEMMNTYLK